MTQPVTRPLKSRQALGLSAVWFILCVLSGLWEVGWSFSRLPGWFYAYAVLAGVIAPLGLNLISRVRPEQPYWQRIVLHGFGWGIPVMTLIFGGKLLNGEASQPHLLLKFLLAWSLGSLMFGLINERIDRSRFKDWL